MHGAIESENGVNNVLIRVGHHHKASMHTCFAFASSESNSRIWRSCCSMCSCSSASTSAAPCLDEGGTWCSFCRFIADKKSSAAVAKVPLGSAPLGCAGELPFDCGALALSVSGTEANVCKDASSQCYRLKTAAIKQGSHFGAPLVRGP